jgi:hypothetical protein
LCHEPRNFTETTATKRLLDQAIRVCLDHFARANAYFYGLVDALNLTRPTTRKSGGTSWPVSQLNGEPFMSANVAALNNSTNSSSFAISGYVDASKSLSGLEQELNKILEQVNQVMGQLQHRSTVQDTPMTTTLGVDPVGGAHGATHSAAASPSCPSSAEPTSSTKTAGVSGDSKGPSGLSTAPQTKALSQKEGHDVAEQYIANLQKDFGLTRAQASGIVANLWHESGGMNSGINQGGKIGAPSSNMADDNGNGYGIAQWGGSRKQGLIDYANQHGLDPSSQAANYGFLKQELQTSYSSSISAVKGTSSAEAATQAFANAFEQPSDPQMASRFQDLQLV